MQLCWGNTPELVCDCWEYARASMRLLGVRRSQHPTVGEYAGASMRLLGSTPFQFAISLGEYAGASMRLLGNIICDCWGIRQSQNTTVGEYAGASMQLCQGISRSQYEKHYREIRRSQYATVGEYAGAILQLQGYPIANV